MFQIKILIIFICIGYCSIQWASTTTDSFIVTGVPGAGFGALTDGDCLTDFVVIPNPYYTTGVAVGSDRFCGTAFTTVVSKLKEKEKIFLIQLCNLLKQNI